MSLFNVVIINIKGDIMKNVGSIDRVVRIVIGAGVLGAGFYFENCLGLIGIIPLLTALTGKCPLYMPFGISTCKTKTTEENK